MKRTEVLNRMQQVGKRVAELGQAVQVALQAKEHTPEDPGAIVTAAGLAKTMADEFKSVADAAHGKEARVAGEFEQALRRWSYGARLLADGIVEQSKNLLGLGVQHLTQGSQAMADAIGKLS